MTVLLQVPAAGQTPALQLRAWRADDMPSLLAEMRREGPDPRLPPNSTGRPGLPGRIEPGDQQAAERWLASRDLGWRDGDWLTFAVLSARAPEGGYSVAGHVGLTCREDRGPVSQTDVAEVGYWTAVTARGQRIAPAAVRAVTGWAFDVLGAGRLREIWLVHDLGNDASCRVADKSGYPLHHISPANPPLWYTAGHVHVRERPVS